MSEDFIVPLCQAEVAILFVDEAIILVDKPSGLLSVPGKHPLNRDCLITRVQQNYPDALIVHRLDMDTSGVMVLARGKDNLSHLSRQFQERQTQKQYLAWVYGVVQGDEGQVDLPLCCDWPNRPKQMVDHERGKASLTYFEVLERRAENLQTKVLLKPVTGRSHQLRVHMAQLGHPISGCGFYAHAAAFEQAPRLQLHAWKLAFNHPGTGVPVQQTAPAPF
ncbi:MAG: RNA pseudouridine synthase [Oceanospirillaceae bacterium]|jgi:tRNA pseudouridine32 synthase/23S rRNA pseudouridine746 synthase|nr:RNA pseudouridine synthase [Oceanospirillaceae bacterium]MBT4444038.1 RNA pseudouridine synthase [Oceanospirillaceae bacterium]MBT6077124.1 RNA pseudouridine synthase [Oceanospirillaceae bacterium]MBT7330091.1 RNA pseudouridine synthase [Oceanospirillaceae bacterium]